MMHTNPFLLAAIYFSMCFLYVQNALENSGFDLNDVEGKGRRALISTCFLCFNTYLFIRKHDINNAFMLDVKFCYFAINAKFR